MRSMTSRSAETSTSAAERARRSISFASRNARLIRGEWCPRTGRPSDLRWRPSAVARPLRLPVPVGLVAKSRASLSDWLESWPCLGGAGGNGTSRLAANWPLAGSSASHPGRVRPRSGQDYGDSDGECRVLATPAARRSAPGLLRAAVGVDVGGGGMAARGRAFLAYMVEMVRLRC